MSIIWRMWFEWNVACILVNLSTHTAKTIVAVGKAMLLYENDFLKNRAKGPEFPSTESWTREMFQYENFHLC